MNNNGQAEKLFRAKSLERISSPDDLRDYIRVANPGAWFILSSVILLLIGLIIWSVFGSVESTVDAVCVAEDGTTLCYVSEENIGRIRDGMTVRLADGTEGVVQKTDADSEDPADVLSEYAIHLGNFKEGEWVSALSVSGEFPEDGTSAAEVIVDSIHPVKFILG